MSINRFNSRLVVSGNVLEYYQYERAVMNGFKAPSPGRGGLSTEEDRVNNREQGLKHAKKRIRRLLNANWQERESLFITLTFAENEQDVDKANAEFNRFVKRLRYKFGRFEYLVVVEFQTRGAVHYHMALFGLGFVPNKQLRNIWGHGFVTVRKLETCDNTGAYVCKYLTKGSSARLEGRRSWWCSRGLSQPVEYT